jgi:hypothetical protein
VITPKPVDTVTTTSAPQATTKPRPQLVFYIPLSTALVTLILLALAVVNGWLGPAAHVGAEFGEAARPGLIKQPVNTFSNFGFVFAGLLIGWRLRRGTYRHNVNPLTQTTFYPAFFASLVVFLGPGSMAMHATETHLGGRFDMLSMYLVAAFLTAYGMGRFFRLGWISFSILFVAVVVICVQAQGLPYSMPLVGYFGSFIFGVFIMVGTLFEALNSFLRKRNHDLKWGALSLGFLLLAFLIWKLWGHHAPTYSLVQAHGIWHLLCAVSTYCLFRYYVSESNSPSAVRHQAPPGASTANSCQYS